MRNNKIECSRVRACKWKGTWSDLVTKENKKDSKKLGLQITDDVCPNCGGKSFYELKENK